MATPTRIPLTPRPAAALFSFGIIGYLGESLTPYFVTAIKDGLEVSSVSAGSVTTTLLATTALAGFIGGPVAATKHRRRLARTGLVLAATGYAVAALAISVPLMYAAAVLAGLGGGAVIASSGAALATFRNPDRVAGLAGLVNTLGSALALATLPLLGLLPLNVFAPLAVVCLIALALVHWLPLAAGTDAPESAAEAAVAIGESYETDDRRLLIAGLSLLVLFAVWGMTEGAVWSMSSELATNHIGLSKSTSGLIFSVGEVAALVGAVLLSIVGGRFGRAMPLTALLVASGILKLTMGATTQAGTYAVGFVAWDFVSTVAFLYFIAVAAGLDVRGRWTALMTSAYMVGEAFAPLVGAVIVEDAGFRVFSWVLAAIGLVLVLPATWLAKLSMARERQQNLARNDLSAAQSPAQ